MAVLFCVMIAAVVYYGRESIFNSLFADPASSRAFQPVEPKPQDSATQWQQLIAMIAIGFEIFWITIAFVTKNNLFVWVGIIGAVLFASLLFYRQIQEKIATFQGTSTAPIAVIPIYPTAKNAVEESTFLRFLVLLLGVIGIFSLDYSIHCNFAPLALPILILGSIWSYQRRHHSRSMPNRIAFFVSLTLTLACLLGPFFSQLPQIAEQNRANFTPFLIALTLLTLHLFRGAGLYLRKDLSIAVLRSTLMVGVAAAVNKDLGFLFFGGSFLALLLPTMVLLYRSNLQLPASKAKNLPWQHLAQIALATILLGSILALFVPHFQLSQLGIKLPEIEQIAGQLPIPDRNKASGQTENSDDPSLATETTPLATPLTTPSLAALPQITPAQATQLQTLQQDLETISAQAPQLSPQEISTVQTQLATVQAQLQQSPVASPASNPIGSIAPSPSAAPLTEQIAALQSTIDQLKNQPQPAASVTASPAPNPQLEKLRQQLKDAQVKVAETIVKAQSSPSPSIAPSKPPLTPAEERKQQEQWTNIARVTVVILVITGGMIWYLRRQGHQERKQKAKRRQFDRLPQVEQLYRLMLKDLAKGNSTRRPPETELEFSRIQQLRCSSPIYKLIAEISADYVAWRYGNRSVNESALAEKFRRFQALYQPELAKKSPRPKKS